MDGKGHAWLRYGLAMRSASRRGLLPRRPARFLDWCLNQGLLRLSGNALQYRHRELQQWLLPAQYRYHERQWWLLPTEESLTDHAPSTPDMARHVPPRHAQ
jgi:hypothetical protein